jgi:hypothetical protein
MKKNNRQQYLKVWLTYLKGKSQIDPKALTDFLGKTLKRALAPITMKRYTATIIINLYENGFLAGKTGKTFSGEPLEIVQEITLPVLDKCLTQNYRKVKFTDLDQPAEPVELVTEAPKAKKPRKAGREKKVEVVSEIPPKKPAKPLVKKTAKSEPKKPLEAKAEKPKKVKAIAAKAKKVPGRKPRPKKKEVVKKPKKEIFGKVEIVPGKKPERKPVAKKPGLIGRKTDLLKMGEGAFLYSLELQRRVEEMERVIANYERLFEAVKHLFSREMHEIEEWVEGLLK